MNPQCELLAAEAASGVAGALRAVDCVAGGVTAQAFGRLFAPGGALVPALTILLTLYVAFFAIRLMLGRSSLGVRALTPRFLTLGLVLTFATSWVAYQGVVWNLAVATPDYLASLMMGTQGSATDVFAQKIDLVFAAVRDATATQGNSISAFSPPGLLWMGATLLLLGTVGVLVTARIALALLVALGPIFVVMGLFEGTRGLFTGWLKGLVMLALTPLFAVLGGSVMLELAVPVLSQLAATPGEINAQAAMAFFILGAVHVALMVMVLKVSATMVAGWSVFGLVPEKGAESDTAGALAAASAARSLPTPAMAAPYAAAASAAAASGMAARRIELSGHQAASPANDRAGAAAAAREGGRTRTTRVFATAPSAPGQVAPLTQSQSRTNGVGSRFRAAAPRSTEKLK